MLLEEELLVLLDTVLTELAVESDTDDSLTVDSLTDDSDGVESDCDVAVLSDDELLL